MVNVNNKNSSQSEASRKAKVWQISLLLLLIGFSQLIVRIFRCELGGNLTLFWINFIFLIVLSDWPTYFSNNPQTNTNFSRFRIFYFSVMGVAFYILAIYLLVTVLFFMAWEVTSDSIIFLPLLALWPIYVLKIVKLNVRQIIVPFAMSLIVILIIPLTDRVNPSPQTFEQHLKAFEEVVYLVKSGAINPIRADDESVDLPCKYRYLVRCPGGQIRIQRGGSVMTIFFCYDRWDFGNGVSGFLYRSDGQDISVKPAVESPGVEVRKLKEHWFWKVQAY